MQTLCKEKELAHDLIKWVASEFTSQRSYRWRYLGEGNYRSAYVGTDGLVYKIPHNFEDECIGENEAEYSNWLRASQLPDFEHNGNTWKVPSNVQLFKFPDLGEYLGEDGYYNPSVIVMPFIKGVFFTECLDGCGAKTAYSCIECELANLYYGLFDASHDNVIVRPDGVRVIIDLQC